MDSDRNHRCTCIEKREVGVTEPHVAFFVSIYLGIIETCMHDHSHGETLNVLTSAGSVRGCSGYEVVPANVIRTALILEFHTQFYILYGQIICSSHS